MRKTAFIIIVLSLMLCTNGIADESKSVGTAQKGTTLSLAYDGNYLYYKEVAGGEGIDRDTSWQSGAFLELRGDNEFLFARIATSYVMSTSARYTGALQNGTPLTTDTKEQIYNGEVNVGFKALNLGPTTLSPYAGIGYHFWRRGEDNLPVYQEDYKWWYVAAGLNFAARFDKLLLSLDGAVMFPFDAEMKTSTAGLYDEATFNIKSRPGFRADASISYTVYSNEGLNLVVFTNPYYQRWNIGASDSVLLTRGGTPVLPTTYVYEPKSNTDIYGVRIGLGINF